MQRSPGTLFTGRGGEAAQEEGGSGREGGGRGGRGREGVPPINPHKLSPTTELGVELISCNGAVPDRRDSCVRAGARAGAAQPEARRLCHQGTLHAPRTNVQRPSTHVCGCGEHRLAAHTAGESGIIPSQDCQFARVVWAERQRPASSSGSRHATSDRLAASGRISSAWPRGCGASATLLRHLLSAPALCACLSPSLG